MDPLFARDGTVIADNYHFKVVEASFPSIGEKIKLFFGQPDFVKLLNELKINNRGEARAGFPADVFFALHELEVAHESVFSDLERKSPNSWN